MIDPHNPTRWRNGRGLWCGLLLGWCASQSVRLPVEEPGKPVTDRFYSGETALAVDQLNDNENGQSVWLPVEEPGKPVIGRFYSGEAVLAEICSTIVQRTGSGRAVRLVRMNTLRFFLPFLLVASALAQGADPRPLVEGAVSAVGGKDKLLKIFRMKEIFHFGSTPEPAEGKKRSTRESIVSQPDKWWINKKERGAEPAKDDVRGWSLDLLVDEKSKLEVIPDVTEEGKACHGLQVSGSVDPAMKFYFAKDTSLLKRLDWRGDIYRFSDWKEHDGVKYASKTIILKAKDNRPWFFHEVTEIERLATLPEGMAKP